MAKLAHLPLVIWPAEKGYNPRIKSRKKKGKKENKRKRKKQI
jgi:hypothetical protein